MRSCKLDGFWLARRDGRDGVVIMSSFRDVVFVGVVFFIVCVLDLVLCWSIVVSFIAVLPLVWGVALAPRTRPTVPCGGGQFGLHFCRGLGVGWLSFVRYIYVCQRN